MASSNKRKGGALALAERSNKVPRTGVGMEPSNPQSSMAALFRANKLVHDLKESQLRTILVQAYVSHPDIAHVVDLEHSKMEHLDEAPSESEAEPDIAHDVVSDSESDNVSGEENGDEMSGSEDETVNRNRKVTQVKTQLILCNAKTPANIYLAQTTRYFRVIHLLLQK